MHYVIASTHKQLCYYNAGLSTVGPMHQPTLRAYS